MSLISPHSLRRPSGSLGSSSAEPREGEGSSGMTILSGLGPSFGCHQMAFPTLKVTFGQRKGHPFRLIQGDASLAKKRRACNSRQDHARFFFWHWPTPCEAISATSAMCPFQNASATMGPDGVPQPSKPREPRPNQSPKNRGLAVHVRLVSECHSTSVKK